MGTRNIEMPDGTLIENVPDNISKEEVMRRYKRKEKAIKTPQFEKDAAAIKNTSAVDLIWGSAPGRFAAGVADPLVGGLQLGAQSLGLQGASDYMGRVVEEGEAARARGDLAYGREGFDWMRMMGIVMNPIGLKLGKALPLNTLGQKTASGAGAGGLFGLLSPVQGEGFWGTKASQVGTGALLGGLLPLGIEGVKFGGKVTKHLLEPLSKRGQQAIRGREYLTAAGDKADDIINLLEKKKELVPGSKPTAAEAAAPAGRAEFAAMQKAASQHRPSEYLARTKQQDAARASSIGRIAKDEDALQYAEKGRKVRALANYGRTHDYPIELQKVEKTPYWMKLVNRKKTGSGKMFVDKDLQALEGKPIFNQAMREVREIAKDAEWNPRSQPARFLHTIKTYLDDVLARGPEHPSSLGKTKASAVNGVRKELVEWMRANVPGYDDARVQFAKDSGPINRMMVGGELKKSLTQPISDIDEVGTQRAGPFAAAIRDSHRVVKKAGQDPRFGDIKDILSADEMARVNNVAADLARRARYEEQARAGVKSAQGNIVSSQLQRETGATNAPNALYRPIMILNAMLKRIQGKAGETVEQDIAEEMLHPDAVAAVMKQALVPKKKAEQIIKMVENITGIERGSMPIRYPSISAGAALESGRDTDRAKREILNILTP